jgi:coenzyme F420-dependent glucose-6-phosphate dehydrogenase
VQIAQAWATLEFLFAGRPFLGFGSGEALNEVPLGEDWPPVPEQIERMEEALELIHALFEGKRLQVEGRHFKARGAILHTRPQRRPPIYVSAFGPRAAGVAARWGDGLWTLGDPDQAPGVIDAYRSACDDSGREPGEIALQAIFAWGADDHAALEGARVWKGAQPPEFYTQDWHDPREMQRHAEQQVSDEELCKRMTISSDPEVHADAARDVERMGATIVALANASGADPDGAISLYGKSVLPALRGVAVR